MKTLQVVVAFALPEASNAKQCCNYLRRETMSVERGEEGLSASSTKIIQLEQNSSFIQYNENAKKRTVFLLAYSSSNERHYSTYGVSPSTVGLEKWGTESVKKLAY